MTEAETVSIDIPHPDEWPRFEKEWAQQYGLLGVAHYTFQAPEARFLPEWVKAKEIIIARAWRKIVKSKHGPKIEKWAISLSEQMVEAQCGITEKTWEQVIALARRVRRAKATSRSLTVFPE